MNTLPVGLAVAALNLQPGQRVRITYEAVVLRVSEASGHRGVAAIYTRAGRGMNDVIWVVREPEFGDVDTVEIVDG